MDYKTSKALKQIGVLFLAAAILTVLPRLLVASIMGLINLALTVAMIWFLYQIFGPVYREYRRRYGRRNYRNR